VNVEVAGSSPGDTPTNATGAAEARGWLDGAPATNKAEPERNSSVKRSTEVLLTTDLSHRNGAGEANDSSAEKFLPSGIPCKTIPISAVGSWYAILGNLARHDFRRCVRD
jgi:hypothetical protein